MKFIALKWWRKLAMCKCVTDHPGFEPVCLNKWCLRLSAAKYKTKKGTRYRRAGFENR